MSEERMMTIWNHDLKEDRSVMCSGGNVITLGPGAFNEFPAVLAREILKCAEQQDAPFKDAAPEKLAVGGEIFQKAGAEAPQWVNAGVMIPLTIFDRTNLLRLDRGILLSIAEMVGCPPLLDEETKKGIVDDIAKQTKFFDLLETDAPPAETGETNKVEGNKEQ